jgi:hypothetical protein
MRLTDDEDDEDDEGDEDVGHNRAHKDAKFVAVLTGAVVDVRVALGARERRGRGGRWAERTAVQCVQWRQATVGGREEGGVTKLDE